MSNTNVMSESAKAFVDLAVKQSPQWLLDIWSDNLSILDKVSELESKLRAKSDELAAITDNLRESQLSTEQAISELNKYKQGYSRIRTESDSNRKSLEVALQEISTLKRELEASNKKVEAIKQQAKTENVIASKDLSRELMNLLKKGTARSCPDIWSSTSSKYARIIFGNTGSNPRVAEIAIQGNNDAWKTNYIPQQTRR